MPGREKKALYKGKTSGQTTIQLLAPLLLLLGLAVAFAYVMPELSSVQALAMGGGIILFVICLASTEAAIYVLIFSMLLSPEFIVGPTGGASLGRGITIRIDDFIILIIGFGWLSKMAIHKQLGLFLKTPLNKPIAYYILACLTSTLLGAMFGGLSLKTGFFFVLKYFEYMLIYFMVVNHLENTGQVKRYVWALLITCLIVSLIGIAQIPEGGRVSAPFEGETGEPNTFGGYLVFMISIAGGLFLAALSQRNRLMYGMLILLAAVPLIYTQSRTSYLAFPPAMLAFVWLSDKKQWVLLALLIAGIFFFFFTPEPAEERIDYTLFDKVDRGNVEILGYRLDTSACARLASWRKVAQDWINHPVFGYGVTGYGFVDAQYFRVLIETGLLGLFTFFLLMYKIFQQGYRSFKAVAGPFHKGLCMGFLAGFVGLLVHGIGANTFIIVRIMEPFWFTLALVTMAPVLKDSEVKTS